MSFCPHCHSGNDPVLKDTTWSCGVRFNDSTWRTKECYRRNLELANDRIKRLEEAGVELRECASQLGWTSSDDSRWIKRAESAVKAWDKEAKL